MFNRCWHVAGEGETHGDCLEGPECQEASKEMSFRHIPARAANYGRLARAEVPILMKKEEVVAGPMGWPLIPKSDGFCSLRRREPKNFALHLSSAEEATAWHALPEPVLGIVRTWLVYPRRWLQPNTVDG